MTSAITHLNDNIALLRQGIEAINTIGEQAYRLESGGGSSIGAHFRHVFDHYALFIQGVPEARIDYDQRARDHRVETDTVIAIETAGSLINALESFPVEKMAAELHISANVVRDGQSVVDWTPSTVQRETMYLLSHTVHHYAIISLLAKQVGVELDPDFGVAPSTLAYRRHQEACAR